ncbi:RNA polymerase II OS=Ureibacillus acetophenoni OX=614649 GN=SAMN05877842_101359 PE=4 SV=1 [Ureibacillus acetophenoni]
MKWVTGWPLIGQQSLTLVNYVMFSGQGDVNEIYYESDGLTLQHKTDEISIYSNTTIDESLSEQIKNIQFLNDEHISIVNGDNLSGDQGERILFLKDLTLAGLNQRVILSQIDTLYTFENQPNWIKK